MHLSIQGIDVIALKPAVLKIDDLRTKMVKKVNVSYISFFSKIRQIKCLATMYEFAKNKNLIIFYENLNFLKSPWSPNFGKCPNFILKYSLPVLWLPADQILQQTDVPISRKSRAPNFFTFDP